MTVFGTRASAGVNVSEAGATVPSVRSELLRPMVTLAAGVDRKATVKVAVPPASVVTRPAVGVTTIPATSSSVLVAETSAASRPE